MSFKSVDISIGYGKPEWGSGHGYVFILRVGMREFGQLYAENNPEIN